MANPNKPVAYRPHEDSWLSSRSDLRRMNESVMPIADWVGKLAALVSSSVPSPEML